MDLPKPAKKRLGPPALVAAAGTAAALAAVVVAAFFLLSDGERGSSRELTVERRTIEFGIDALGTLEPQGAVVLALEVDGTVRELFASPGDRVSKGQRLARLSNEQLMADVDAARSRLLQAQAQLAAAEATAAAQAIDDRASVARSAAMLRFAQAEYAAREATFEKGIISRLSLAESLARLESAQADNEAAQARGEAGARLQAARLSLEREGLSNARESMQRMDDRKSGLELVAPVDGALSALDLVVGQALTSGARVGRVIEPRGFLALLQVPEDLAPMISAGSAARLEIASQEFSGKVTRLRPVVQDGFQMAEVSIDPGESSLGAFADQTSIRAQLYARTSEEPLSVEFIDGMRAGQTLRVDVVSLDGERERKDVLFGSRMGDRMIIRAGVTQGGTIFLPTDAAGNVKP